LKIVASLFLISGIDGVLALVGYIPQTSFLPLDFRALIIAVTGADAALMFIVGAGLLTAKKRWINAAIAFSALSVIMFYIVPLRAAVPLELIAIFYLLSLRRGSSLRQVSSKTPIFLVALLCVTMLTSAYSVNAQLINPDKSLLASQSQRGDRGCFNATLSVYRIADADKENDYYFLEVNLKGEQRNLNYANVNISLSPPNGMFVTFVHTPQARPSGSLVIGFGISTLSIGNSKSVFFYNSQSSVAWDVRTVNPKPSEIFSVEYIVPQDSVFAVSLHAEAKLEDDVFHTLWTDNVNLGTVEIPSSSQS
jgi:hypothetical protein